MSKRKREEYPDPPCEHWDDQIGTITSGDPYGPGPLCGVATCAACVIKSAGYVQMRTGLPAGGLLTYVEARKRSAAS